MGILNLNIQNHLFNDEAFIAQISYFDMTA